FETFEVEGGAAAREKFTFGSAGLTQNEGVVAAKSDRGRSRVTREFVLADDRFEEGVIGELFVGHTGKNDVFNAGLEWHGKRRNFSGEIGEKFELLIGERILRVEGNFVNVVVVVLHVENEIVKFDQQAGGFFRDRNNTIARIFVVAEILFRVVRKMRVLFAEVVALGFGVSFGLAAGNF